MRRSSRAFTLVEILIVVIILGILAAIVIPQFTTATTDAKTNTLKSTLQSMRGQIEFFKLQHNDIPPLQTNIVTVLTGKTTVGDATTAASNMALGTFGPYFTSIPANPLNSFTDIGAAAATNIGWVYTTTSTNIGGITQYQYYLNATDTTCSTTLTY